MASGSIPVIRNWPGADDLYPPRYVFKTVLGAARRVVHWRQPGRYTEESDAARAFARSHFDKPTILAQYDAILGDAREARAETGLVAAETGNPL